MSDDAPLEPVPPEPEAPTTEIPTGTPAATPPTAEAPTQPAAAVPAEPGTTPPGPPPWTPPGGSDAPHGPNGGRSSTVAVPKWVLAVVGGLLIALVGFGIGYAVAPGDDDDSAQSSVVPSPFERNGNNGDNGSGDLPTVPLPERNLDGAFLGVVTTRSTDPDGARITQVLDGSPAADAGLEVDDVITKVDDEEIATPAQLAEEIGDEDSGEQVTITYVRDGDTRTADAELTSRRDGLEFSTPSPTIPDQ
jgi:hypothetical protein